MHIIYIISDYKFLFFKEIHTASDTHNKNEIVFSHTIEDATCLCLHTYQETVGISVKKCINNVC